MGNLEENDYRRREQQILRDEKEEMKEIKDDIIQKLKLMKITGFDTLEEFLRSNRIKISKMDPRELKDMNKQYKSHQYAVLEKLLEFKYFNSESFETIQLGHASLFQKREDLFRFGDIGEDISGIPSFDDIGNHGLKRVKEYVDIQDTNQSNQGKYKFGMWGNVDEEGTQRERGDTYRQVSDERRKFVSREKKRIMVKVSKYLKKNNLAKV